LKFKICKLKLLFLKRSNLKAPNFETPKIWTFKFGSFENYEFFRKLNFWNFWNFHSWNLRILKFPGLEPSNVMRFWESLISTKNQFLIIFKTILEFLRLNFRYWKVENCDFSEFEFYKVKLSTLEMVKIEAPKLRCSQIWNHQILKLLKLKLSNSGIIVGADFRKREFLEK